MPKNASALPSRTRSSRGAARFADAASKKPKELLHSLSGRLLIEMLFHSLPIGALVLDARRETMFANDEALNVLSLWHDAGKGKLSRKHLSDAVLPADIDAACESLRQEFTRRSHAVPLVRPNFAARLRVIHPGRSGLCAVVSLQRSRRNRSVAGFCVILQNRLTLNIAAGRGDQLALLSPAERGVAKLVANGLRNVEIGKTLGKSVGTVKAQLRSIFEKLEIRTRTQLASLLRSFD
jgi:DNA-binding CsgD family transcriptional regulator